ncbi:hypothetical protein PILCRDRAFT_577069 [Piloderma croceum F 1598]|uniref:Uncharacterized protein n=1 Tax=Piloderma croceum (strain F 1598) TaxID=765440 RepID=A0A0C3AXW0_PILCF|nr:hypothetical protein PILCRDRAFT_577069 [Piloderma croceum F 1598]
MLDAFKMRASSTDVGSLVFAHGKLDCPELCREELIQDGGRGIMTLLKSFLLDNNEEPPKRPIPIHDLTQSLVGLRETRIQSSCWDEWLELTLSVGYASFSSYLRQAIWEPIYHNQENLQEMIATTRKQHFIT